MHTGHADHQAIPQLYRVTFHSAEDGPSADDASQGEVQSGEMRASDLGLASSLEDMRTAHITCILWCTCQYFLHWGLPCAHQLRVMLQENVTRIPNGVIHRRWLPSAAEAVERRQLALVRARASELRRAPARAPPTATMTADQRRADVHGIFEVFADFAKLSSAHHQALRKRLDPIFTACVNGTLLLGDSYGMRTQQAAAAQQRAGRSAAAAAARGDAAAASAAAAAPSADFVAVAKGKADKGKRRRGFAEQVKSAGAKAAAADKKRKTTND